MIYLNFTDLNQDTQGRLLENARKQLDMEDIKVQAELCGVSDIESFIDQKAAEELRNNDYIFNF